MLFSLEFKDGPSGAGSLISKESRYGPNKEKLESQARRARKNCLKCPLFLPQRIRGSVKVPRLRYNPMKRNPRWESTGKSIHVYRRVDVNMIACYCLPIYDLILV